MIISGKRSNFLFSVGGIALLGCGQKTIKRWGCPIMVGGNFLEACLYPFAQHDIGCTILMMGGVNLSGRDMLIYRGGTQ